MPWLQTTSKSAIFIYPFCHQRHHNGYRYCVGVAEVFLDNMTIGKVINDNEISKEILRLTTQDGIKLKR